MSVERNGKSILPLIAVDHGFQLEEKIVWLDTKVVDQLCIEFPIVLEGRIPTDNNWPYMNGGLFQASQNPIDISYQGNIKTRDVAFSGQKYSGFVDQVELEFSRRLVVGGQGSEDGIYDNQALILALF